MTTVRPRISPATTNTKEDQNIKRQEWQREERYQNNEPEIQNNRFHVIVHKIDVSTSSRPTPAFSCRATSIQAESARLLEDMISRRQLHDFVMRRI